MTVPYLCGSSLLPMQHGHHPVTYLAVPLTGRAHTLTARCPSTRTPAIAMQLPVRRLSVIGVLAFALTLTAFRFQQDEPKTPLGQKMAAINTAFKAVGRQVDDPSKNASTLEQLKIIETNAKAALRLEPEKKGTLPASAQAKFVADFQRDLNKLVDAVEKAQVAVKAGKNAEASALVDSMKSIQRDSHKEYRIRKAGAGPGGEA